MYIARGTIYFYYCVDYPLLFVARFPFYFLYLFFVARSNVVRCECCGELLLASSFKLTKQY